MKKDTKKPKADDDSFELTGVLEHRANFGFSQDVPHSIADMSPEELEKIKKRVMALQKRYEQKAKPPKDPK